MNTIIDIQSSNYIGLTSEIPENNIFLLNNQGDVFTKELMFITTHLQL